MKNTERINGFDALRTVAMWLGIVLHAIIVYKTIPEANWPHDSNNAKPVFDWLYDLIHLFRMPLFFLVAGFFARLVLVRSGISSFLSQRFKRIVIPFVIGIILLAPLTLYPFHFYSLYNVQNYNFNEAVYKSFIQCLNWNGMVHLWFLYYLIIFYTITIPLYLFVRMIGLNSNRFLKRKTKLSSLLVFLFSTSVLFLIILSFEKSTPPVYTGIKITLMHIVYYGFFYWTGWLLQINMQSISKLFKNGVMLFFTGLLISIFTFLYPPEQSLLLYSFLNAVETTCLIAGIIGLFIKYFNAENQTWRYLSDASYWVYLIHMFIVATTQVILINTGLVGWLRLPVVLFTAFSLSLLSYHYFVRFTIIGDYLHGKRFKKISMGNLEPVLSVKASGSVV